MGELPEQELIKFVGKRVDYQGFQGTVRYVGPVHSTSGTWLGIDWDDPTRGKHDGSHENVQYFKTSSPTSGSFVRASKVNLGVTFLHALKEKYIEGADQQQLDVVEDVLKVLPRRTCRLRDRPEICLERCCIVEVDGAAEQDWQLLEGNSVGSLFLSCNLFTSWEVVGEICRHFPALHKLVLRHLVTKEHCVGGSSNRLELPEDFSELSSALSSVSILALNKMAYDWVQIQRCLRLFPHLTELDISSNRICSLELPESLLPWTSTLTTLDLSYNPLDGWRELVRLGSLPNLQVLSVESVGLSEIELPPVEPPLFPALRKLYLSNNQLSQNHQPNNQPVMWQWRCIAQLSRLPHLQELTLQGNPLWGAGEDSPNLETCKQLVIAKLPHLTCLNKMTVTAKERREAEFDYVKRYFRTWTANRGPDPSHLDPTFLAEHPTYPRLLAALEILCPQINGPPISKKLPETMAVGKVKMLVKRLLRLSTPSISLSYTSSQGSHEVEMDNDLKEIGFYSITNGDQILVRW